MWRLPHGSSRRSSRLTISRRRGPSVWQRNSDRTIEREVCAAVSPSKVGEGFELDPYISGLFLLGERLEKGGFHELVNGTKERN